MSLPHKPGLKPAAATGAGTGVLGPPPPPPPSAAAAAVPPPPASASHPGIRALQPPPPPPAAAALPRGALAQGLDERLFPPSAVSAVYSSVAAQVARQPGPPGPSPYSPHDLSKGHPNLAATPPGHASSPGLSQASYATGQSPAPPTLVYTQPPQSMSTQPQTRSPFAAGPRATHHQFFPRSQMQPARAAIQSSSPAPRPAPPAVYQTNQHIMMVNHLPMPYAMPQGHQYCIPQYRHSSPPFVGAQQYPVQPPGPGPFYTGPGDFSSAYGAPFYASQPVYQSAPIIVPPQQPQPPQPPAKREKKTIRIRDPNQGGKDITEEIMSGGGSRNPTPPILRPSSTPTPPQAMIHAPDQGPLVYGAVEGPPLAGKTEEKPPASARLMPGDPVKCAPPDAVDPRPELLPAAAILPVVAEAAVLEFPRHLGGDASDGEEAEDLCKEALAEASPLTAQEMNGVSYELPPMDAGPEPPDDTAPPTDSQVPCTSPLPSPVQPDSPPPPLIAAPPCTTKTSPPTADPLDEDPTTFLLDRGDPLGIGRLDSDSELEMSVTLLSFTSSPGEAQDVPPSPVVWPGVRDESPEREKVQLQDEAEPAEETGAELEDVISADPEPQYRNPAAMEENGPEPVRNGVSSQGEEPSAPEGGDSAGGVAEQPQGPASSPVLCPPPGGGKRQYDRDFLLGFQFMPACVQRPEGLPPISDVVLDKINQPKLAMRSLDPRMLQKGPDFTPAYADFTRLTPGGRGVPLLSVRTPRRVQAGQGREPRKIIMNISASEDVVLKRAENAWRPSVRREGPLEEPENTRTQALFRKVRSILNKLTPQMFNQLMKQVSDLTVDTEERLKGVIDLVFEKAIDEPSFSVAYANMCRCLATLKVPMADKPGNTVNFRKLLLNRCQKEFEKDKADDDENEKKQKDLELATTAEERARLQEELDEARDRARRRSIGNIRFIGELFKLRMLTEAIMHDCVVKLLKNHDEESLECLCRLLTTIGKDLDFQKAKPRMDQYFHQMEKIVKERKTSSRIRFMLQDVIDLRLCNWVSRRADQGPKTIEQIHKEAKIEEQEEQRKVQQLITKDKRRPGVQRVEEGGWNMVQGAKNNRVLDPSKFLRITKPTIDEKIQLVPKAQPGSWGKGSSGGAKSSETEPLRPGAPGLNRFSPLQPSVPSLVPCELEVRRASHGSSGREKNDKPVPPARPGGILRGGVKDVADSPDEREISMKTLMPEQMTNPERTARDPAKAETPEMDKSPASEEELERKSKAIIDEFLHINDYKEAVQCVEELAAQGPLSAFVRVGVESTLERSQITRDHMGQLMYQLLQGGTISKQDFFSGIAETLELADDMAIDIPHIWLYLAEIVTPMLKEGGISLNELVTECNKAMLPAGRGGVLLSQILHLLCKQMSHKRVAALWRETGLRWKDLLAEGEDVQRFVSEQDLGFTLSEGSGQAEDLSRAEMSAEELNRRLEQLIIQESASDEQIFDWVEASLSESQMTSPTFLRALMSAVCKATIVGDCSSCRVDTTFLKQKVPVLVKYMDSNVERELQALYSLQTLIVTLDQPPNLLRMFFDCLYDEEVISEDAFYRWESSQDPAEQSGKGVALKSVTAFFTWLREAEEESEDN